jgi:hypothetical protein
VACVKGCERRYVGEWEDDAAEPEQWVSGRLPAAAFYRSRNVINNNTHNQRQWIRKCLTSSMIELFLCIREILHHADHQIPSLLMQAALWLSSVAKVKKMLPSALTVGCGKERTLARG